jgi:hypothetical protein
MALGFIKCGSRGYAKAALWSRAAMPRDTRRRLSRASETAPCQATLRCTSLSTCFPAPCTCSPSPGKDRRDCGWVVVEEAQSRARHISSERQPSHKRARMRVKEHARPARDDTTLLSDHATLLCVVTLFCAGGAF